MGRLQVGCSKPMLCMGWSWPSIWGKVLWHCSVLSRNIAFSFLFLGYLWVIFPVLASWKGRNKETCGVPASLLCHSCGFCWFSQRRGCALMPPVPEHRDLSTAGFPWRLELGWCRASLPGSHQGLLRSWAVRSPMSIAGRCFTSARLTRRGNAPAGHGPRQAPEPHHAAAAEGSSRHGNMQCILLGRAHPDGRGGFPSRERLEWLSAYTKILDAAKLLIGICYVNFCIIC